MIFRRVPAAWKTLATGILLGIAFTVAFEACVNRTQVVDDLVRPLGRPDTAGRADVIVLLAAGMTANCSPNLHGIQRVLLASRLYHEGRAPLVLISGGRTADTRCAAADGMHELVLRLGVPPHVIRVERASSSTWQNALRSDAVLRTLGAKRILLVTDKQHLRRAEGVFRRFGYEIERAGVPVYLGHADNVELLELGIREYAALMVYWWRGLLSDNPEAPSLVTHVQPAPPRSPAPMRSEGSVVILGASYGKGWTPTAVPGVSFVNKGVAGEQSFEMLKRFEADVVAQNARAVIIWGFINDIFRTNRQDVGKAIAQVRENYLAMLERAEAAGIMPVLATEVTMGPKAGMIEAAKILVGDLLGKQGYADYVNRHVMDTNTWLRELALSRGLHLLDFENALAGAQGRRRRLYTADDGSHLTAAAYEALSRYADPHLRDWLQK